MHIAYREDGVGSVTVSVCCSDGVGGVAVSVVWRCPSVGML